ncbi:MAG: hypothetical protein GX125_09065 [Bacteroidales bacterium]|jgi:hypothetical protein|nr:hypothetical protein [Bacteroidales bacterium]
MKIKPLAQLGELIAAALKSQTNLSESFPTFFIETMELTLTHIGRFDFTRMARFGRSCESRIHQNFKKAFDWLSFNKSFPELMKGHRIAIAIDPCYIPKSGKKRQTRKVFISTDTSMSTGDIFNIYRIRFRPERFIALSGKTPNMRLNNTDFKELLFHSVRAVA